MKFTKTILASTYLLFLCGFAIGAGVTLSNARGVSDKLAVIELEEQEMLHRKRDPDVRLDLSDYKVTERDEGDEFHLSYQHTNSTVGFVKWRGHPMHFTIVVNKSNASTRLIGGR